MRPSRSIVLVALAILAVHVALAWIYYVPDGKRLWGDEETYYHAALSQLESGDAGLPLLWPPLYVQCIAATLVFPASLKGLQLGQWLLLLGSGWILRDLTRRWTGSSSAGNIALALSLGYPPLVAFVFYLWPENLHLFLMLAAFWLVETRCESLRQRCLLGVVLGLALLTKNLLGPFIPVLLWPLLRGRSAGEATRLVAPILAVALAVVAPTVWSNAREEGRWVVADSSRFNLWVGLNEQSRRNFSAEIVNTEYQRYLTLGADARERHEALGSEIAQLVRERGVLDLLGSQLGRQYFRLFDKDSFLTDQLPGGAIRQAGSGYLGHNRLLSSGLRWISYTSYLGLLLFAALGLAVLPRSTLQRLTPLLLFVVYNLALFLRGNADRPAPRPPVALALGRGGSWRGAASVPRARRLDVALAPGRREFRRAGVARDHAPESSLARLAGQSPALNDQLRQLQQKAHPGLGIQHQARDLAVPEVGERFSQVGVEASRQ